jgi:hypothetical protein
VVWVGVGLGWGWVELLRHCVHECAIDESKVRTRRAISTMRAATVPCVLILIRRYRV